MFEKKMQYEKQYRNELSHNVFDIITNGISYSLFITNDNLGGTRQYEKNYLESNKGVIVLRRMSYGERPDLIYQVWNTDNNKTRLLHLSELYCIWDFIFTKIVISTLVHYSELNYFIDAICKYKSKNVKCYIVYLVHDYDAICVNCNLFIVDHYCNLQCNKEKCDLRLSNKQININQWRVKWNKLFATIDEIQSFSNASNDLIKKVYSDISTEKFTVVPHDINYIQFKPIEIKSTLPFKLGIVGNCNSDFKGRPFVKKIIRQLGDDLDIRLVGSDFRFYRICKKKVKYLGAYEHKQLQVILEEQHITCVLFPSLCPETFSYLVSELIAINIPIICLNYGAQAEKVREYKLGVVFDSEDAVIDYLRKKIGN